MPAGMSHLDQRSLEFLVGLLRFDARTERPSPRDRFDWGVRTHRNTIESRLRG